MLTLAEIRNIYLKFFEKQKHLVLPSSSLVPDDPTLMFTNSGMVQLKDYFAGLKAPPSKRITTCQKCIRAGGKHNDLENVGYTARHHTFFEMLGNFSIGDYFKKEAITWAWELLTDGFNLPQEKLLVTVYHTDDEAIQYWKDIAKLADDKIIRIKTKDNFWEMGDTGPCGPCTEIFYDHGDKIAGGKPGTDEEDGDRYIEIWNNVFTQFERQPDGELKELKFKNIDTGMGIERIAAVLQGVHNNYDIDLFKRLIDNSKTIIGDGGIASHRVIADHLRSSSFLIADGVLPSNEGRGYVLRRIMRRAMRHIHQLGQKHVSMFKLVPCLIDVMGETYPELNERESFIMETLEQEEVRFRQTLERGLNLLEREIEDNKSKIFSGATAFTLYDTYGFPLDLTQDILRSKNIEVDTKEFDEAMASQKERSKWVGTGDKKNSEVYYNVVNRIQSTEFLGYDNNVITGKILAIIKDGVEIEEAKTGDEIEFFVDKTSFYGEMGGQCGDSGVAMQIGENGIIQLPFSIIEINDVKQPFDKYYLHKGKVESGLVKVGDFLNLAINTERRNKIKANHSAVHLLESALRKIYGDNVIQKGSSVDDKGARYDFALNKQVSKENLVEIERIVNDFIYQKTDTVTKIMPLEEAKKTGAIALFGEKYGDTVRVLFIGEEKNEGLKINGDNNMESVSEALHTLNNSSLKKYYSVDFCGGTHVKNTGDIGAFKIISESSIGSGIRRIEILTGLNAIGYLSKQSSIAEKCASLLGNSVDSLFDNMLSLFNENKEIKKELDSIKRQNLSNIDFKEEKINNVTFASITLNVTPNDFKGIFIDKQNKKYNENSIMVGITKFEGKSTVFVGVSKDLTDKFSAKTFINEIGKGGGQNWFAMGSMEKENGIEIIKNLIQQ
ncbi:MAG: alanine--tRNA ligase [Rickettsiales bacterium]|jgi:alanyl-tRNA synthetase|nr:alanine--tRNA ligase [Rickettsiales bacterium]